MKVFTVPEKVIINSDEIRIFLAGSIEQGKADEWQNRIINEFKNENNLVFFNPRRKEWDASWVQSIKNPQFKEQVLWELNSLELADIIIFYFDGETKSPISLLELGLHANDSIFKDILVYCPKNFYRKGNVDIVCEKYEIKVVETEEDLISELKSIIN